LPGLDHVAFTAAANYLHFALEQQEGDAGWKTNSEGEGPLGCEHSDDDDEAMQIFLEQPRISDTVRNLAKKLDTNNFLDRLAQVFALEKTLDRGKASTLNLKQIPDPNKNKHRRPPKIHVIVTAMIKGAKEIDILVAKISGLDQDDKVFAIVTISHQ